MIFGENEGLWLAELSFPDEATTISLPLIDTEVTDDHRYSNFYLSSNPTLNGSQTSFHCGPVSAHLHHLSLCLYFRCDGLLAQSIGLTRLASCRLSPYAAQSPVFRGGNSARSCAA